MRLLADFHHADLFESHQLLFGDRFGWEVFAPYGMDWFDRWYWSFEREHHGDAVGRQYLLGIWEGQEPDANGLVTVEDSRHPGRRIRGVTLDAALAMGWDIVLSSVPSNANGFERLARETGAQWGIHVGNQWGDEAWSHTPAFALLTTTSPVPAGIPYVVVHQEFDRQTFRYEPPVGFGPVRSFVNSFAETPDYQQFIPIAKAAPDLRWEVYGAIGTGTADEYTVGDIHGIDRLADAMRGSGAIWHAKHWSDGFGHVIHNAFAVGRPVFGRADYYRDKLAGPLWIDGVTSYDTSTRSVDEVYRLLRELRADPERHLRMCEAAAARFDAVVDFAADADLVARLLGITMAVAA